jgi:hypothetical protein
MQLDALALNQGVQSRDSFRWWQFNYLSLQHYSSPETASNTGTVKQGIFLHWTLPEALRNGVQNSDGNIEYPLVPNRWLIARFTGTNPRVASAAWVLESDCPKPTGSTYDTSLTIGYLLDPTIVQMWQASNDSYRKNFSAPTKPQVANIGIAFPLAQGWSERSASTMFLTAVSPGNHVFPIYTQHNMGVFSFYDALTGIDNDIVSYLVTGWYSDPQQDILASWQKNTSSATPYQDLLQQLQWTVAGDSTTQANATLYEGMVFSIPWQRTGNAPGTPPAGSTAPNTDPLQAVRNSGLLNVSIGNTTVDAFQALVAQQFKTKGYDPSVAALLEAFQYDMLQLLNQPNGDAILAERIRQEWYQSKQGGYSWDIVDAQSDGSTSTELTDAEAAWLLQLNIDQSNLDQAVQQLYSLQWNLQAFWYRLGWLSDVANTAVLPQGVTNLTQYTTALQTQLDGSISGTLANQVITQITNIQALMKKVPQPNWTGAQTDSDAYQNGIDSFAQSKNLDPKKVLKSSTGPRYWKPNNPVVMISGVEPPATIDPDAELPVRLQNNLVTGFKIDATHTVNTSTVGSIIPMPANLGTLPSPIPSLIQEYFFLDPAGASSIAAATGQSVNTVTGLMTAHDPNVYQGTLPSQDLTLWQQPWQPMFVEWELSYNYIPYLTNALPSWTFDGTDYHFTPGTGTPALESTRSIKGISLLSPHAQFVFGERLKDFLNKYGSTGDLQNLYDWIEQIDQWQFVSQELTGFNELLALHDDRAYRDSSAQDTIKTPSGPYPLPDLLGNTGIAPPGIYTLPDKYGGQVNSVPYFTNNTIPFHGVRQGQAYFVNLWLYDKFGRELFLIQSSGKSGLFDAKNFPLIRDPALVIDTPLSTNATVAAPIQFPPRALQFARLDFDLVDGKVDTQVLGLNADVNPIAGWVLPNHIDNSILLFAPDGTSLGEFRLLVTDKGTKIGQWQAPPHSTINTLDDVGKLAPHVQEMLQAQQMQDPDSFLAFLDVIDSTLWTTDPLGDRSDENLSVLIGRPLALVRARLRLSLDGPAITDPGWGNALNPPAPDFLNFNFSVRLGDQATRQDGVIGFYLNNNYATFNSVAATTTVSSQKYVQQIGPLGQKTPGNYIQLQFSQGSQAYVSMLVDPRASIHAFTGILPAKEITVPAGFIDPALAAMEVGFRIGPMLTPIQATPTEPNQPPQYPNAISYPFPAEQNGQWSWWENDAANNWNPYALLDTTPNAQFLSSPNTLRDGILQLILNLNTSK